MRDHGKTVGTFTFDYGDGVYEDNTWTGAVFDTVVTGGLGAGKALVKSAAKQLGKKLASLVGKKTEQAVAKELWGSWADYSKVTINGQEYAKIGDRLYSRHAVDRMQPSGNRYGSQITQAGGDYGRSVSPNFVEYVIQNTKPVVQENGNLSYTSGTLQIITNKSGVVVTIITK
ncbi:hypothetical protein [Cohnella thermotolerans]|uniref:hypothetical protein n=1 Tax=Cohnella thermotolerans TaxID=329858 RepID=UPI0012EC921B|nr:hypothetical protein [Cohnella thermotolerans]